MSNEEKPSELPNKVTIVFAYGHRDVSAVWRMSVKNLIQAARLMGLDGSIATMDVEEVRVVRPR